MILSNLAIHKALDEKRLIITPEPAPRLPQHDGTSCPYNNNSVDLRLDPIIRRPTGGAFTYDLMAKGPLSPVIEAHSEEYKLTEKQPYPLATGEFVLGMTLENVELPIGTPPILAARIEGKSSRARCGILIHFTAPTVHAGWRGKLALEIANLGPATFLLRPGMYIAQLILEPLDGLVCSNPSVFQNQTTPQGK